VLNLPRNPVMTALGAALAGALGAAAIAHHASAETFDPSLPIHMTVGGPTGPWAMQRADPQRTARTGELPDAPRELWRRMVRGGIELAPIVDDRQNICVAGSGAELTQLSASGQELWRTRVGISTPTAGPVIMSDETRFVLTALGEAWGVSATGANRFHTELGWIGRDPRVAPLPRDDGSVVVAITTHIVVLDSRGAIRDNVDTSQPLVGALVQAHDGIVATSEAGHVILWAAPLAPRVIGTFRGAARDGTALVGPHTLVAVVDRNRLVAMDLRSGQLTTRASAPGLEGPPTVGPNAVAYSASTSGLLVGSAPSAEPVHVALTPPSLLAEDGGSGVWIRCAPPLVADRAGRVAFVRGEGKVGVVLPGPRVVSAPGNACADPIALVAAGPQRFLVACRSGTLVLYGP
jgi:hypothetical protein